MTVQVAGHPVDPTWLFRFFAHTGSLLSALAGTVCSLIALVQSDDSRRNLRFNIPGAVINSDDATGALITLAVASFIGTNVELGGEMFLHRQQIRGVPRWMAIVQHVEMVFSAIFLLAAAITVTYIISTGEAVFSAPGMTHDEIEVIVRATGGSPRYRDGLAFPAIILAWPALAFKCVAFALISQSWRRASARIAELCAQNGIPNKAGKVLAAKLKEEKLQKKQQRETLAAQ